MGWWRGWNKNNFSFTCSLMYHLLFRPPVWSNREIHFVFYKSAPCVSPPDPIWSKPEIRFFFRRQNWGKQFCWERSPKDVMKWQSGSLKDRMQAFCKGGDLSVSQSPPTPCSFWGGWQPSPQGHHVLVGWWATLTNHLNCFCSATLFATASTVLSPSAVNQLPQPIISLHIYISLTLSQSLLEAGEMLI